MVSENVPAASARGAPKHGSALLSGLLRCRRCGRKLCVQYTGAKGQIPRYACVRGRLDQGEPNCIAFGGLRVDDAVEAALLAVVQPAAVEAARAAEAQTMTRRDEACEAMKRDLEAARYTADRAFRQYDAADPENRLVAGELEARWNRALTRVAEFEARIADHDAVVPPRCDLAPVSLMTLADDLHTVWSASTTDARLKKRIVRTLIHEALADLDDGTSEIVLTLHWVGGAHTEHRLPRRRRGQRNCTSADVIEAIRNLSLIARDDVIAGVLNRNGLKTGHSNRWTRERVTGVRSNYGIPVYRESMDGTEPWLNLSLARGPKNGVHFTAHGLAVDGDDIGGNAGQRIDPGDETSLEGFGIERRQDVAEVVVRGSAAGERPEAAQKLALLLAEAGDVDDRLGSSQHGQQAQQQDLVQRPITLPRCRGSGRSLNASAKPPTPRAPRPPHKLCPSPTAPPESVDPDRFSPKRFCHPPVSPNRPASVASGSFQSLQFWLIAEALCGVKY